MKKRIAMWLTGLGLTLTLTGGTLVYRAPGGEEKMVADVKIESITGGKVKISINGGYETISLKQLVKYYDTDIKSAGGGLEDSTCDYTVRVTDISVPDRGLVKSKGKRETGVAKFSYSITRSQQKGQERAIRVPYFYLFLLVGDDSGGQEVKSFSWPKEARMSGKGGYDEAKMLENILSLKRPVWYDDSGARTLGRVSAAGNSFGGRDLEIKLSGIGDKTIYAWHLVVWGKDKLVFSRGERRSGFRTAQEWYLNRRGK